MPRYELMYILASSVSDDQVPAITEQIKTFITDFGGTELEESQLGKKKLAYPIKKTRNGFYVVDAFSMDGKQINEFEAKIRAQNSIIRHILVNMDEHMARLEKDKVEQSKLTRKPEMMEGEEAAEVVEPITTPEAPEKVTPPAPAPVAVPDETPEVKAEEKKSESVADMTTEELDKKIEAALTEDLLK